MVDPELGRAGPRLGNRKKPGALSDCARPDGVNLRPFSRRRREDARPAPRAELENPLDSARADLRISARLSAEEGECV